MTEGMSPSLNYCSRRGRTELSRYVSRLFIWVIDVVSWCMVQDPDGLTALELAQETGRTGIIALFG